MKIDRVKLKRKEQALLKTIKFDMETNYDYKTVRESCSAAAELTRLLFDRGAIPKIRIRYFLDPELNIGGRGKSRKDVFTSKGRTDDEILRHPHFLKYLKYFIYGPNLPEKTIARFQQIVVEDRGTSGMVLDRLRKFARAEARNFSPQLRSKASEEFFKLSLESGLDGFIARSIRDAVRTVK